MNTADRSIRSIDLALRRRLEVFECTPDRDILSRFYETHTNEAPGLIDGFEQLNADLSQAIDRHHTIGHLLNGSAHDASAPGCHMEAEALPLAGRVLL